MGGESCLFLSYVKYLDEKTGKSVRYRCLEPTENILPSGLCIFHDENYLKNATDKDEWNLRKKFSKKLVISKPLICVGYHLPHLYLENEHFDKSVNFSGALFMGFTDFSNTQFKDAIFAGAQFTSGADFSEAKFSKEADFSEAKFSKEADFSEAKFTERANFIGTQFTERANFSGAQIEEAVFSRNQLNKEADFSGAQIKQAVFSGIQFKEADFSGAQIKQADFSEAQFTERADFIGAQFTERADFIGAQFTERADFIGAQFARANFVRAQFTQEANFVRAQFTDRIRFDFARFTRAADFFETRFSGDTNFLNVQFDDQEHVQFLTDSLSHVSFLNTDISRVKFGEDVVWGDKFKIRDEREIESQIEKNKLARNIKLRSVIAVYRNLRENYEYRMRYDEAGQFFMRNGNEKKISNVRFSFKEKYI